MRGAERRPISDLYKSFMERSLRYASGGDTSKKQSVCERFVPASRD